ncbi:MAG: hypothetical protein IJ849_10680 [Selenomonadaceae bacterium]|nr:hypothetical protein [Selenomonadaceae bacterium]
MFNEYEEVRIKSTGKTGLIVDKTVTEDGKTWYVVEDDVQESDGKWPLYDVWEDDLEYLEFPVAV